MAYSDQFNITSRFVKFNDVADAINGLVTRQAGGIATGSNVAYISNPSPSWQSPIDVGAFIAFVPHLTNGASPTLNVSNTGAVPIQRGGVNISAGTIVAGVPYLCLKTASSWEVLSSTEVPAARFLPITLDQVNNRVGINSTTPVATLDVYRAIATVPQLQIRGLQTSSGGNGLAAINLDVDGKGGYTIHNKETGGNRSLQFLYNDGYGANAVPFFTALLDGRMGFGANNTNPKSHCHVYGSFGYSGLGNVVGIFGLSGSHASVILGVENGNAPYIAAGKMADGTGDFTSLRFKTSNVDALVIQTDSRAYFSANQYGRVYHTQRGSGEGVDAAGFYCQVDGTNYGWMRLNSAHTQLEVRSAGDLIMYAHGFEKGRFGTDGLGVKGGVYVEGTQPTLVFRDENHRSSMLHCNSNRLYFLRGTAVNSITWIDEVYPLVIDLEDKSALFGGYVKSAGGYRVSDSTGVTEYGGLTASTYTLAGIGYNQLTLSVPTNNMLFIDIDSGRFRANLANSTNVGYEAVVYDTASKRLFYRSSSVRYKTEIEDIQPQYVENLYRFRPVWYRYKPELPDNTRPNWSEYGLIAEEAVEIEPRIVGLKYSDDSYEVNSDTLKPGAEPYPETVLYEQLIPLLVAGLQVHKKEMDLMRARLAAMEAALGIA